MYQQRLLFILLDAFRYDYLTETHMPNLLRLSKTGICSKLESVLGYSNTVMQTILTGTYPNVNDSWTDFILKPKQSRYGWIEFLPFDNFPHQLNVCIRFAISEFLKINVRNIPFAYLKYFEEIKPSKKIPTLFDYAKEQKIKFVSHEGKNNSQMIAKVMKSLDKGVELVFLKLPDLDLTGHIYGTRSKAMAKQLFKTDKQIMFLLSKIKEFWKDDYKIIIASDHGMTDVKKYINPKRLCPKIKEGKDFFAFYDATLARFWFKNQEAKRKAIRTLNNLKIGHILPLDKMKEYGILFSHQTYGELFFLLDPGFVFYPNYYSVLPFPPRAMHGYDPVFPDMLGLFMIPGIDQELSYIKAVDLLPTILDLLGISCPTICQGTSVIRPTKINHAV